MPRLAFLTSSHSKVLDYLLYEQKEYSIILVDFSNGFELKNTIRGLYSKYIEFFDWRNLSENISKIDLIISYKLPNIIPLHILESARYGAFNVHPSLLPKYKGLNPWYDLYYDGELKSGVTIHKMSSIPDEGNIISQLPFNIEFGEPLSSSIEKSEKIAVALLRVFLSNNEFLISGTTQPIIKSRKVSRTIDTIKQLPVKRMWHLFRGFPALIRIVFPELPHETYEVQNYFETDNNSIARVSNDFSNIYAIGGVIQLVDTKYTKRRIERH